MSTSTADLKSLIALATARGATVHTTTDGDYISTVQVIGLPGIGHFPMAAIAAAEALRAATGGQP